MDGQFDRVIWVPQNSGAPNLAVQTTTQASRSYPSGNGDSTAPRDVALDAVGHVPLPPIQLRMNPALGLVHLPGWFWMDGYDGRPFGIERRVTVPPEVGDDVPPDVVPPGDPRRRESHYSLEVRLRPSRYAWDFGDGEGLVTHSLGKPAPTESDIQHTYEYSSLGLPEGFPVRLTVTFAVEYRVNGGSPQPLPDIVQTYVAPYQVQEIQSVLTQ